MVVFYPKVRDKYWLYGRKNRTFVLYLSITILLIGVAFIGYYYWSAMDYNRAEYKADVTATLVGISDDKQPVYEYYWEYEINGKTEYWCSISSDATAYSIGEKIDLRLWSDDGVTYYRTYYTFLTTAYYFAITPIVIALFLILRCIIVEKRLAAVGKKKK